MKKLLLLILCLLLHTAHTAHAGLAEGNQFSSGNTNTTPAVDAYGQVVRPIQGGPVQTLPIASGVTTNTTPASVPGVSGFKTFRGEVVGTGAVSVIIDLYGDDDDDEADGVLLLTMTLSGTTKKPDAVASITANFPYFYITTRSISGTGATVNAKIFY